MSTESWRPVQHQEDGIEVSNNGRVAAVTVNPQTGETLRTIIAPFKNPCGYLCFMAPADKMPGAYLFIHEEVALAFKQQCSNVGVLHNDGNIENNHASNLVWTDEIEECDYFDCGCSDEEMQKFAELIKQLSNQSES